MLPLFLQFKDMGLETDICKNSDLSAIPLFLRLTYLPNLGLALDFSFNLSFTNMLHGEKIYRVLVIDSTLAPVHVQNELTFLYQYFLVEQLQ